MNRLQIHSVVICFLALFVLGKVANAQSKDRDNPTRLISNVISGQVDSESRGNYYFYSFIANPGEVSITLTVEPGRKANDSDLINFTGVNFSLYDRNAAQLAGKEVSTADNTGPIQAVARVDITRRQLLVLGIYVRGGFLQTSVGGRYRLRIDGSVELGQGGSTDLSKEKSDTSVCLPKQGTLIIKMKDGSKKIIDLSEADTVTVVP